MSEGEGVRSEEEGSEGGACVTVGMVDSGQREGILAASSSSGGTCEGELQLECVLEKEQRERESHLYAACCCLWRS